MAYSTRTTFPEPLWNISLLPTPALRRAEADLPPRPPSGGGGSSLPTAALLSLNEHDDTHVTSLAA